MSWSTDISAAPRGKCVKTSKIVGGKTRTSVSVEREPVWLASKCGKVILSYWLWTSEVCGKTTKARWIMLSENEQPLAWYPFTEGEFPGVVTKSPDGKRHIIFPNGEGPAFPAMLLRVVA